ncbi:MAG TPA: DoxX family protein, partial [Hyphomicrobiaceae bacterium]|nr:DoxX family protein [Hyphomicrobiaceae bacterium]
MQLQPSEPLAAAGLTVGRLLLASLFILEGWSKIRGYEAAAAYMDRYGVPGLLLPAVIALELGGGLMMAVGWRTRLAAFVLAVFCIAAA